MTYRLIKNIANNLSYFLLIPLFLVGGCKKLLEVDLPIDKNTSETVFSETSTAVAAINSVYVVLATNTPYVGESGISLRTALAADELKTIIPQADYEYLNSYTGLDGWNIWDVSYREVIYRINSILENIARSKHLPERTKEILTGEAKFTRAWLYFYLTNFYGDVPLVLSTDFKVNSSISRSPLTDVYKQIEQDLLDAQNLLKDNFLEKDLLTPTSERIRPNKTAATALLARVYLYLERWADAENEATKVITNSNYKLEQDLNQVFLKTSSEAIWQLQPNLLDPDSKNAPDGRWLINTYGGDPFYFASNQLLGAFESGDARRDNWIGTSPSGATIIYKYKEGWGTTIQTEYTMVLRLPEQYLIRSEARAKLNKLKGANSAESDINEVRHRANLPSTNAVTINEFLTAIDKERQTELFLEWGDRWLNLKRTKKIDSVMSAVSAQKGTTWQPFKALFPIPYEEFKFNSALRGHQNPGYLEQP